MFILNLGRTLYLVYISIHTRTSYMYVLNLSYDRICVWFPSYTSNVALQSAVRAEYRMTCFRTYCAIALLMSSVALRSHPQQPWQRRKRTSTAEGHTDRVQVWRLPLTEVHVDRANSSYYNVSSKLTNKDKANNWFCQKTYHSKEQTKQPPLSVPRPRRRSWRSPRSPPRPAANVIVIVLNNSIK